MNDALVSVIGRYAHPTSRRDDVHVHPAGVPEQRDHGRGRYEVRLLAPPDTRGPVTLGLCATPIRRRTERVPLSPAPPAGGRPVGNPDPIPPGRHPAEASCRISAMEDVSASVIE